MKMDENPIVVEEVEYHPRNEFNPEEDKSEEEESPDAGPGEEDCLGPFLIAKKIIEQRDKNEASLFRINWKPSRDLSHWHKPFPSLVDLCLKVLSKHAEEIESLEGVLDFLKNTLTLMLCHSRKMNARVLGLIMSRSPTSILLSNCNWAREKQIEGAFAGFNAQNLKVLQVDLCGQCVTDYVLSGTLARSTNCLPSLTKLSLKGAYRLTDDGLNTIVSSAPS